MRKEKNWLAPNDLPYKVGPSDKSLRTRYRAFYKMYHDDRNKEASWVLCGTRSAHFYACLHWAGMTLEDHHTALGKVARDIPAPEEFILWNPNTRQLIIDFKEKIPALRL